MSAEQSVTRQAGTLIVGRVVAFLFAFALPLVLARIFSQGDFGLYKQLFLIHATLASSFTFGFGASLFYFVPHYADQRDQYVSQTLLTLVVLAFCGAGLLILFKAQVAHLLNDVALEAYIPYLAVVTALWLVTTFLESLMIILKQAKLAAATALGSEIVRAALMIGAAALTHSMRLLLVAAIGWAMCRVIALLVYLRKIRMRLWTRPDWHRLVEQVRYAFPFGLALILATLATTLHQYVVSYLYTPALFAIYSVGYLQIPIVAIAFESVSDVTLVRLTELRKSGMLAEGARLVGDSVTKLCLLFVPLYVWLLISAHELIVLLFTDRYAASVGIFRVFITEIPLAAVTLAYVPRAFADTGFILRLNVLLVVLSILLLGALAPLGLIGAALASVLADAITKGFILLRVRRLLQIPTFGLLPWRRLGLITAASLIAAIPAWAVHAGAPFGTVTRLFLSGAVGAFCYSAIVWRAGLLEPEEKRHIMRLLNSWSGNRFPRGVASEPVTIRTGVEG